MTIYISGPMTGIDNYEAAFDAAQADLEAKGHKVINPAHLDDCFTEGALTYLQILDLDLHLIDMADAVALLPGWAQSRGCMAERGYATAKDLTIIYM